ncbi:hypothetical protein ADLECEL_18650 [Adlercreutzia equolifaciens subsp. celatus]|uniref:site-specific DNA-methyltransferase (adenine-specific) n=1 Tax=Adlercreutzia equolifaciens subsp. celatus DSM 18785 TaxID=1121021 RepID=A0A3N0ANS2_9ACTN|nr:N-6 DNA methylase [Adlercreutzia equolifaciens]MCP2078397.1 Type I restriction modification DNA specificity domain-containing protein [Adlercreutzia equolifaciens subsp. celatus DSM 18785]RFT92749.1 hypothetical protein DX904_06030 [Adlercreutzia equolifaciens subsp. celatus]RNL35879.1 hypothetical protein DMP10_11515 [Adlercreutzia equolifaciens subsp. celatus DSM 18785]BCS57980.1 hypothetical protein ADLECEL_18650 [Adlercreutzia equolifaciens subsp. celatus]
MSEELSQRDLISHPFKMGDWCFYNIGSTTLEQLKRAGIISDRNYGKLSNKRPDALITLSHDRVIACVEYKQAKELSTEKKEKVAIEQELEVARILGANVLIVTDGCKKTIWVNPATGNRILDQEGNALRAGFSPGEEETLILLRDIVDSIHEGSDQLSPTSPVDPLPLAREIWQDLWTVSGATPENCLYTFVEIFIFKYLSDLGLLRGFYSFGELIKQYGTNSDEEVLEYYADTIRKKIKELFPKNTKDGTTIINGTIFVSKDDKAVRGYAATFKKILGRFENFGSLENIDRDFKSRLFETFLKQSISKKNWGQYFTPLVVVQSIIDMTDIRRGMSICDPACGVGKFLLEAVADKIDRWYSVNNNTVNPQVKLVGYDKGFDKDEQKTIILAKANMLIYFSGLIKSHPGSAKSFSDLFNDTFLLQTNSILGTLAYPINDEYDLILTNPPYVMNGSGNLKEEIHKDAELSKYYTANGLGIEGLFLEWIVNALKEGGKAFIVLPDGVMSRRNDKNLREYVRNHCTIDAIISLPINTFYSTDKKTYVLALTKKERQRTDGIEKLQPQSEPVFAYLCSEIGETRDVYRFPIEQNDLQTATQLFNMYKGSKSSFKTDDPRCKLLDINTLIECDDWCVDRLWSDEEKVNLGIKDPLNMLSIDEFAASMQGIIESLNALKCSLEEVANGAEYTPEMRSTTLGNEALFEFVTNSINLNKVKLRELNTDSLEAIPVYSAQRDVIAHINELVGKPPIFASPEEPILSFATNGDGSAGRNFVLHDKPFYISRDRIGLRSKDERMMIDYIYLQIKDMKELYGFNHSKKANRANVRRVEIAVPVNPEGLIDADFQRSILENYAVIEELQSASVKSANVLEGEVSLDLSESSFEYAIVDLPLLDLFETEKGSSKLTRGYGFDNSGSFPVWSASSKAPLTMIDTYDYEGRYLSWSTNGFAGLLMVLEGRFSINGDRGVLIPKRGRGDLDLDYFKYTLEPIFRQLAKGRKGDNGENEYTKLSPKMLEEVRVPVPVTVDGLPDLAAQEEMAKCYRLLDSVKSQAIAELAEVRDVSVSPMPQ